MRVGRIGIEDFQHSGIARSPGETGNAVQIPGLEGRIQNEFGAVVHGDHVPVDRTRGARRQVIVRADGEAFQPHRARSARDMDAEGECLAAVRIEGIGIVRSAGRIGGDHRLSCAHRIQSAVIDADDILIAALPEHVVDHGIGARLGEVRRREHIVTAVIGEGHLRPACRADEVPGYVFRAVPLRNDIGKQRAGGIAFGQGICRHPADRTARGIVIIVSRCIGKPRMFIVDKITLHAVCIVVRAGIRRVVEHLDLEVCDRLRTIDLHRTRIVGEIERVARIHEDGLSADGVFHARTAVVHIACNDVHLVDFGLCELDEVSARIERVIVHADADILSGHPLHAHELIEPIGDLNGHAVDRAARAVYGDRVRRQPVYGARFLGRPVNVAVRLLIGEQLHRLDIVVVIEIQIEVCIADPGHIRRIILVTDGAVVHDRRLVIHIEGERLRLLFGLSSVIIVARLKGRGILRVVL